MAARTARALLAPGGFDVIGVLGVVVGTRGQGSGAAGVPAPGLAAFLDGDDGNDQGGERIGPGPAEGAVERQPYQQHRRQVDAEQGLLGVGDRAGGAELATGPPLGG
jgi:hypothetical protein